MSAPSTPLVKRIPAELYWNPTNVDSATQSDWGTRLGNFDNLVFHIGRISGVIVDYVLGSEVEEVVGVQTFKIGVLKRDFDKDAFGLIFPEMTTQTNATLEGTIVDNADIAGRRLSTYAGRLFLRPRDPDFNPSVYFYNAVVSIPNESEVPYDLVKNWGVPVIFRALPDSDKKKARVGNTTVISA